MPCSWEWYLNPAGSKSEASDMITESKKWTAVSAFAYERVRQIKTVVFNSNDGHFLSVRWIQTK